MLTCFWKEILFCSVHIFSDENHTSHVFLLQRVLVTLDRHPEALVVAERACTRAFIDLLMERQAGSEGFFGNHVTDPPPITTDQILNIVQRQKSMVLYFSVASGFLYSWLLTPRDGEFLVQSFS